MRAANRFSCSAIPASSQILINVMPLLTTCLSSPGSRCQKAIALLLVHKAHNELNTRAIVPTAVEDTISPAGRKPLDVALDVHLRLFAVGRRGERCNSKSPRANPARSAL